MPNALRKRPQRQPQSRLLRQPLPKRQQSKQRPLKKYVAIKYQLHIHRAHAHLCGRSCSCRTDWKQLSEQLPGDASELYILVHRVGFCVRPYKSYRVQSKKEFYSKTVMSAGL